MRCLLRHVREKEQHLKEADRASSEWLAERRRTELKMKLVSYIFKVNLPVIYYVIFLVNV